MESYSLNISVKSGCLTILYRSTYNGHFWLSCLLKKQVVPVAYDWFYFPHLYFFRRKLLVVNLEMETGAYREMNKKRFTRILRRKHRIMKQHKETHTHVEREFREHRDEMTSESFWRKLAAECFMKEAAGLMKQ